MLRCFVRRTPHSAFAISSRLLTHNGAAIKPVWGVIGNSQCRAVSSRKGPNFYNSSDKDITADDNFKAKPIISPDDIEQSDDTTDNEYEEDGYDEHDEEADEAERQKIRDELDSRKGRLWSDPWEITEEDWSTVRTYDELPDWTPDVCSRISKERVQIYQDGVPTLSQLARLPLPALAPPHPGHEGKSAKTYAKFRKQHLYNQVVEKVIEEAHPEIENILKLSSWDEKQEAVDALFENVEFELRRKENILSKHPSFSDWVERALEDYLREQSKDESGEEELHEDEQKNSMVDEHSVADIFPSAEQDKKAMPLFVDLFVKEEGPDVVVPNILHPLKPHPNDGPGRMVEEWELSAHKKTRRILLRQSTRQVAQLLDRERPVRIFVNGRRGVGKSATLATIVASARMSGSIVLYLPDGDRLRKNGYYIEPSARRNGMFDLPILSQEVCDELLQTHEADLEGMAVESGALKNFLDENHLKKMPIEQSGQITLVELLELGRDDVTFAPMCYSIVVDALMKQSEKHFVIVADEFNCYYDHGHYFHMDYDANVNKAIPCNVINLFEPVMNAMGLIAIEDANELVKPKLMKRGGVVVATTESHAVAGKFTRALKRMAEQASADADDAHIVQVPHFSSLEVQHVVANFEATGIGRLRFDLGETVMNDQEVSYIHMVSGGVGQNVLDECIL